MNASTDHMIPFNGMLRGQFMKINNDWLSIEVNENSFFDDVMMRLRHLQIGA